jgi:uncharacterized protein (DUF2126 family)
MLKDAAKDVLRRAKQLQSEGRMPLVLGTEGLVALMWDKFQRSLDNLRNTASPTNREEAAQELLTMVAEGLLVYYTHTKPAYEAMAEQLREENEELAAAWSEHEEIHDEEEEPEEEEEPLSEGDGSD